MSADLAPDQRLRLPDGRTLGYCIYGDPHGMPRAFPARHPRFAPSDSSSRMKSCKDLGVALVAPDRWGYGLSEAPRDPVAARSTPTTSRR